MQRPALFALATAAASITLAMGSAHAQSASYAIDPTHTFASFEIDHFGAAVNRGRFEKKEGTITLDKAAKTGKVEITFQISSITTGTPPFDKHLQSAEIFDAAQFPTAVFVGDKFSWNGDKVTEVAGTLTLKGKAQPATFKARQFNCYQSPMLKREVCGGDFEATIQRTQFGIDKYIQASSDNVRLIVQVEAVKQ